MPSFLVMKFGDGDYTFALKLKQILELQRLCGAGIFTIYGRVMKGVYAFENGARLGVPHECEAHALDVYETLRLALIGGNAGLVNGEQVTVNANRASELVETYAHPPVPLKVAWHHAFKVLEATVEGYEGPETQKKSQQTRKSRGSTKARPSTTAASSGSTGKRSPSASISAP